MKKTLFILFFAFGISSAQAQCNVKVMEAFGGTSSIAMYNTYITIGAVADGYVGEVYDAQRVQDLMAEQVSMLNTVVNQINVVMDDKKNGLSASDAEYLQEMKICFGYLSQEAQGLSDYAATGSEEANTNYDLNRDLAWLMIEEMLGLGGDEE